MKIDLKYIIQTVGFIGGITSVIFLMIEALYSEVIKQIVIENGQNVSLVFIEMAGFIIALVIAIISTLIGSEYIEEIKKVYLSTLIAFLLNFLLWVVISYIFVLHKYPTILENNNGIEKIIAFPTMIYYFSVYILDNLTLLWLFAGWTHAIIYVLFLVAFGTRIYYKPNSKAAEGTFF